MEKSVQIGNVSRPFQIIFQLDLNNITPGNYIALDSIRLENCYVVGQLIRIVMKANYTMSQLSA